MLTAFEKEEDVPAERDRERERWGDLIPALITTTATAMMRTVSTNNDHRSSI